MNIRLLATAGLCAMALSAPAFADVTATLNAEYFEVAHNTGCPDFCGSGSPDVALGSSLGPDGLPVVSSSSPGVSMVDPTTNELEWWSPSLSGGTVISTGSGTVTLPYGSNMYAPDSTGTNGDGSYYETAIFSGTFNLAGPGTVSFTLGSDDDSFIYVDGILIGQNPGIHGVTTVEFTSGTLPEGANTIEVFYDDREPTGAYLSLTADSDIEIDPSPPSTDVPEPGSLMLLASGLGFLNLARRRRK